MLYIAREKAVNFYGDYLTIVSEAKHASLHGKRIKIFTREQMLQ